jgi:hypothetical protein
MCPIYRVLVQSNNGPFLRFCTRIWNNVRLARVWQFVRFGGRSRRRCGNVGTRVLCGFPSSEGRQSRWAKRSIILPSERHFHGETPFNGRSGGNLVFGRPPESNSCLSKNRLECTFSQILAQSPFCNAEARAARSPRGTSRIAFTRRSGFRVKDPCMRHSLLLCVLAVDRVFAQGAALARLQRHTSRLSRRGNISKDCGSRCKWNDASSVARRSSGQRCFARSAEVR